MSAVSGLEWNACRTVLDGRVPGAVTAAIRDADTFFGIELPALSAWTFGAAAWVPSNDRTLSEVTRRRDVEDAHGRGSAGSLSIEALGRSRWRLRRTRGTRYVC
jgi:hypothetical protein